MKLPPLSWWLVGYAAFVFSMGVLGYLSNPEKAGTALKSGGMVAFFSVGWALAWARGHRWALGGALGMLGLVGAAFVWRSTVGWLAVAGGDGTKLTAALLISALLVATVVLFPRVLAGFRGAGTARRADAVR
jgi:hypothetical protein